MKQRNELLLKENRTLKQQHFQMMQDLQRVQQRAAAEKELNMELQSDQDKKDAQLRKKQV